MFIEVKTFVHNSMVLNEAVLWKLLIDRDMNKTELRKASGITTSALAKLGKNEDVNTQVLTKICGTLHCNIEDIMEVVDEGNTDNE